MRQHRGRLDLDAELAAPAAAHAEGPRQPANSASTASAKTSVWRSTSAAVVAGDISAMLWNGVISTRRFIAAEVEEPLELRVAVRRTARRRRAAASA